MNVKVLGWEVGGTVRKSGNGIPEQSGKQEERRKLSGRARVLGRVGCGCWCCRCVRVRSRVCVWSHFSLCRSAQIWKKSGKPVAKHHGSVRPQAQPEGDRRSQWKT
jgi:hypothetical protein